MALAWLSLCALAALAQAWQDHGARTYRLPPIDAEELPAEEWGIDPIEPPADVTFAEPPARERKRGGLGGGSRSPLGANTYWTPSRPVIGQASELALLGTGIDLAAPLSMQEGNVWLATAGMHRLEISSSAILPDTQRPLPDELWKVQVGAMHFRELANGWQAGGILSVGSSSDEPFAGLREMTATAVGFLNIPSGGDDAWNFSLFYSPTSQLPFPIPGVAYVWRPNEQLEMKIGVPFSIEYRPTETLTLSGTYMPLTNVRLLARQQLGEQWQVFGGYEVVNESYFLADRVDRNDLLYFFDQRVRVGVQRKLMWGFQAEASVAYLFDREIFQARSFSSDRYDELSIESGLMGMLNVSWMR